MQDVKPDEQVGGGWVEYRSQPGATGVSRARRSVLIGAILFGTVYLGLGAFLFAMPRLDHAPWWAPLVMWALLLLGAGYLVAIPSVCRRGKAAGMLLVVSACAAALMWVGLVVAIVETARHMEVWMDWLGVGLVAIFPVMQVVWMRDVVRLWWEEQA